MDEGFLAHLGAEVRRRRGDLGLTMQELAVRAGLSRRLLGQIESGEANPSLMTLGKLARALDVELTTLVREPTDARVVVNPAGSAPGLWTSAAGSRAVLTVASTLRPSAEVWDWVLVAGDAYVAEPDPVGSEELFLVLSGALTLSADGVDVGVLPEGASARLATDRAYGYRNDGTVPTRFIRIAHVAG